MNEPSLAKDTGAVAGSGFSVTTGSGIFDGGASAAMALFSTGVGNVHVLFPKRMLK
jgi:hypothetical protein